MFYSARDADPYPTCVQRAKQFCKRFILRGVRSDKTELK